MPQDSRLKLLELRQADTLRRKREKEARQAAEWARMHPGEPMPQVGLAQQPSAPPVQPQVQSAQASVQSAQQAEPEPSQAPMEEPSDAQKPAQSAVQTEPEPQAESEPSSEPEQPTAEQTEQSRPQDVPVVNIDDDDDNDNDNDATVDMNIQPTLGGTDRTPVKTKETSVANPPRRGGKKNRGDEDIEMKQVRGVPASMIEQAQSEFPGATIGDAVGAFIAWKSGNHDGLSSQQLELLKKKINDDGDDPTVELNNTILRLSKHINTMNKRLDELEVLTTWVFIDRLGLRPAGTMPANIDAIDVNSIPDLARAMVRLRSQSADVIKNVKLKEGRIGGKKNITSNRSQEIG